MEIKIYSTNWCPYCANTKRFLDEKGIKYEEHESENNAIMEKFDIFKADMEAKITLQKTSEKKASTRRRLFLENARRKKKGW